MTHKLTLGSSIVAIVLMLSPALHAEDGEYGRAGVSMSLGAGSYSVEDGDPAGAQDVDVFHFSPTLFGEYRLIDAFLLTLEWGFAYTSASTGSSDESNFALGNPVVGVSYDLLFRKKSKFPSRFRAGSEDAGPKPTSFRVGLLVAPPLASAPEVETLDELVDAAVYALNITRALGTRGTQDPWLWMPDTLSLVVPVDFVTRLRSGLVLGAGADFALLIPIDDQDEDTGRDTEVFLQGAVSVGYEISIFTPGLRVLAAWAATADDGDAFQLAVEPFVEGDFDPAFVRLGLVMNIDEPSGFAFSEEGIWGLNLTAGASF